MEAATQVSLEEYLRTSYQPDREYLNGEIVERSMPNSLYPEVPANVGHFFKSIDRGLYVGVELLVLMRAGRYRVAGFALYSTRPDDEYPSQLGLVVSGVLSPTDPSGSVHDKLM